MNTKTIKDACDELDKAKARLVKLEEQERSLHGLGKHQHTINLMINGVVIPIATIHDLTYQSKLIRGHEMLLLGAQKAMRAMVQDAEQSVANHEKSLRDAVQT